MKKNSQRFPFETGSKKTLGSAALSGYHIHLVQTGKIDVAYVAQLCRLKLNQEEIDRFNTQLGDILKLVEQLQKIDVSGVPDVPPDFAISGNVLRKDEDRESFPVELALQNAPSKSNDLFIVPKIVE